MYENAKPRFAEFLPRSYAGFRQLSGYGRFALGRVIGHAIGKVIFRAGLAGCRQCGYAKSRQAKNSRDGKKQPFYCAVHTIFSKLWQKYTKNSEKLFKFFSKVLCGIIPACFRRFCRKIAPLLFSSKNDKNPRGLSCHVPGSAQ